MNNLKDKYNQIIIIIAILLLVIALGYQHFQGQQDIVEQLNNVIPDVASYEKISGKYEAYKVFDEKKEFIGYVAKANASAYGGPITLMVGINPEGHILRTEIIDHFETPWFLERVIDHGFLEGFKGKAISDSFALEQDLDGVSGATLSAEGIANAVRKAAYQVSASEFELTVEEQSRSVINIESIILLGLFAMIFIGSRRNINWIRPLVLITSLFFLGFWLNSPIALGNFASLLSGNIPSFIERPFWYLLIIGTLLITLFLGRNIYCNWLCPFGAVQEGLHKVLPIFRYKTSPKLEMLAQKIRWVLTWLALMLAFIYVNPSMASFEPFSAFFKAQANTGQWIIMILVLIITVPIYRFWCRFFCPVGAVLDLVGSFKNMLGKKEAFNSIIQVKAKPKGCMGSGDCNECMVNCHQTQTKEHLEGKQPFFVAVLVIMYLLILYTLILNIGLLS